MNEEFSIKSKVKFREKREVEEDKNEQKEATMTNIVSDIEDDNIKKI